MESAKIAAYVSIGAVVATILIRRCATCIYPELCLKSPLVPESFGTVSRIILIMFGIGNLVLQAIAITIGDLSDVALALVALYNLFSILWILSPDKDAAAASVGVGCVFALSATIVQGIIRATALGTYLLIGVGVLSIVDFIIYVIFVPCFQNIQPTPLDTNMNEVDKLRGQLLELQVKIQEIEMADSRA